MKYVARLGTDEREFVFERRQGRLVARVGDRTLEIDVAMVGEGEAFSLIVDGRSFDVVADGHGSDVVVQLLGDRFTVHVEDERERAANAVAGNKPAGKRELRAAMPGVVVEVLVTEGAEVEEGQTLIVLEAMKMQNPLTAEGPGKVTRVAVAPGQAVAGGALLVEIE